jgi:predicted metal-dependent phosphoesterase TrpH
LIDLHTHSNASDGSLSPEELIRAAAAAGLTALALTDHDTIDGLEPAKREAAIRGIRFIPGIELEIAWEGGEHHLGEFHLLGLGIHRPSGAFLDAVADLVLRREARNREILKKMRALDIRAEYEELRALSGGGSIGRPHFAALLVKRGIVRDQGQAFTSYLGQGKPLYVPKQGLDLRHALTVIKESGGIAVLAHPMSLYVAWGRFPALIQNLASQGLDGIEAWHPTVTVRMAERIEELGRSLGLFITGGSDFHGEAGPDRKLGISAGGRALDEAILNAIPDLTIELHR